MTAFRRRWRWWTIGAATAFVNLSLIAQSQPVVPSFADLTIRTHRAFGPTARITEILSLKGARERREEIFEVPGRKESRHITITQCDRQRTVQLNVAARLFGISSLRAPSQRFWHQPALPEATGADVTITFDTVDTGERRTLGSQIARRVRSTITVEPSPGANTPRSSTERDGWYIDLPGLNCSDDHSESFAQLEVVSPDRPRDRRHIQIKRTAKRGYAIEETTRFSQSGVTHVDEITLIAFSEDLLDSSLFEIPGDYRAALPLIGGGFDMDRPDTIPNRLHLYSEQLAALVRSWTDRARAGTPAKRAS